MRENENDRYYALKKFHEIYLAVSSQCTIDRAGLVLANWRPCSQWCINRWVYAKNEAGAERDGVLGEGVSIPLPGLLGGLGSVGWGGEHPSPWRGTGTPPPHSLTFGVSISAPRLSGPSTQIPGYAYAQYRRLSCFCRPIFLNMYFWRYTTELLDVHTMFINSRE